MRAAGWWVAAAFVALCALPPSATAASDRHAVFISDLHLGAGLEPDTNSWRGIEDFRWSIALRAFLDHVHATAGGKADLVLLGDVFELWQSPFMKCDRDVANARCTNVDCEYGDSELGCTGNEAAMRLRHILEQHAETIRLLDSFASKGSNAVHIVPGNHDAALLMPEVQRELRAKLPNPRVHIVTSGAWISKDELIYGEHGHQGDDVNRWKRWPKEVTRDKDGKRHMIKPWGENMVQRFYNQYEAAFPIVDNFLNEADGVDFAVKEGGFKPAASAVGEFLRFFLFRQSLGQATTALGRETRDWDLDATRAKPPAFFVDVLLVSSDLGVQAKEAADKGLMRLDARELSDLEVHQICARKEALRAGGGVDVQLCPKKVDALGAAVKSIVFTREGLLKRHLRTILGPLEERGAFPALYVFGHTHTAVMPYDMDLGELSMGQVPPLTVVNTGAFQRVGSHAQIHAALARKRAAKPTTTVFELTPDDLPDCHTFVVVAPYEKKQKPVPQMWRVLGKDDGSRAFELGQCRRD